MVADVYVSGYTPYVFIGFNEYVKIQVAYRG